MGAILIIIIGALITILTNNYKSKINTYDTFAKKYKVLIDYFLTTFPHVKISAISHNTISISNQHTYIEIIESNSFVDIAFTDDIGIDPQKSQSWRFSVETDIEEIKENIIKTINS